ncbi:MAG TPA: exo-alpha-sialidase [Candidatus Handelsmanbacteria bacterium]|nr:exo-alpha-sialidase [Candidatus Handelsmanbacteria bacterium]
MDAADHRDYATIVLYSDTDGHSWQISDNDIDVLSHESQEAHVVELHDGRLLLMFRTYSGSVGRAWSSDRGQTWSEGKYRTPLVSAISQEEGWSWGQERILEGDKDDDYGYQSVLFSYRGRAGDGRALLPRS